MLTPELKHLSSKQPSHVSVYTQCTAHRGSWALPLSLSLSFYRVQLCAGHGNSFPGSCHLLWCLSFSHCSASCWCFTLRLYRLISWLPCSEFCWQALLCSRLGCVHPGLAVWVLGTFTRAWEPKGTTLCKERFLFIFFCHKSASPHLLWELFWLEKIGQSEV